MQSMKEIMQNRYSCRKFSGEKLPDDLVREIIDLTRLSPSSCGLEPWIFIVISSRDDLESLGEICNDQDHVKTCSHAVIIMARNDLKTSCEYLKSSVMRRANTPEKYGKAMKYFTAKFDDKTDADIATYASKQCYLATANLVNIAQSLDVKSCIIAGFDAKKLREFAALSSNFSPVLVVALGRGETNSRQKIREPLENVMIWR